MDMAPDAQIVLRIELGRAQLSGSRANGLRNGSIVTLDKQLADAVEIFAAGQLVALGELVVIDGVFCIRVTQRVAARQAA
jgi:flagellar motor switch protein FliN